MSTGSRNFYEILKAAPNASLDQLKANYKQLILQCHPDKLQQQQEQTHEQGANQKTAQVGGTTDIDTNNSEFLAITEAWNTLKDQAKRKQYDAELLLAKFETHNNIYAEITLADMKKCRGDAGETVNVAVADKPASEYYYTYDCRCGGQYIVDESAELLLSKRRSRNDVVDNGANDGDDDDGGALIVECNECSLSIILND